MSEVFLPDPAFRATTAVPAGRLLPLDACEWDAAAEGAVDRTLASTPLHGVSWSALFAYMHRRFGPPHLGGDPYKDLSAKWLLTTPDPDTFMAVMPHVLGAMHCFRLYRRTEDPKVRVADQLSPAPTPRSLAPAYRGALLDLLRPVEVRDSHINALGVVEDDDPLLDFDGKTEALVHGAERHPSSGYPMPRGMFGDQAWVRLCGMVSALGKGDIAAGKAEAIRLIRDEATRALSCEPGCIRLLVGAALPEAERAEIMPWIGYPPSEVADVRTALSASDHKVLALPELTADEIVRAARLLDMLGIRHDVRRSAERATELRERMLEAPRRRR